MAINCSWCSKTCRDPEAKLNEECAELIECPLGIDRDSCESNNCVWIESESGICNDPTFTGCFASPDTDEDAGFCPSAVELCTATTKEECLQSQCSWCKMIAEIQVLLSTKNVQF